MFPVTDFNFMVAGIATVAATVGYTYARGKLNTPTRTRRSPGDAGSMVFSPRGAQGSQHPTTEVEPPNTALEPPMRRESLKRKEPHDGFEEGTDLGYPHNLANIYPRKRCRTPSSIRAKAVRDSTPSFSDDIPTDDWVFIQSANSPSVIAEPPRTPSPGIESTASPTPAPEITDSPLLITKSISLVNDDNTSSSSSRVVKDVPTERDVEVPAAPPVDEKAEATDIKVANQEADLAKLNTFSTTHASTPASPFPKISLQKPFGSSPFKTRGFADFAGNKSPFGAFTATQTSLLKSNRPIWTLNNQGVSEETIDIEVKEEPEHVLTQATVTAKPIINHITGEEDEDVEMELKGVKLFVKRGNQPFADGIGGHFKLLAHKATLEERLLFRREPLWKVSMNVRISPSVRCSYDASENVLRILTQEPIAEAAPNRDDGKNATEIVVYAMKPGRSCSKQDFKEFSETLMKNTRLKPSSSA